MCAHMCTTRLEECWWNQEKVVVGIDEAGRGALAGPVVAGAVVLNPQKLISGMNDSKKLSAKKRAELYDTILRDAIGVGVGVVPAAVVDNINILQATLEAMRLALRNLQMRPEQAYHVLVDGNRSPFDDDVSHETVVGGDAKSQSIAAASVVAKVTRDRMMVKCADTYPEYGFERHKGYGTSAHYKALAALGPVAALHRQSFRLR